MSRPEDAPPGRLIQFTLRVAFGLRAQDIRVMGLHLLGCAHSGASHREHGTSLGSFRGGFL